MGHERNNSTGRQQSNSTQNFQPGSLEPGFGNFKPCLFFDLCRLPGVICGHKALKRIRYSDGTLVGQGLAIGGLITGYLGILFAIILIPMMFAIAIPNFVRARTTSQQNACINNLRLIDSAKQQWALEFRKQATDTPAMQDLKTYLGHGPNGDLPTCPAGGVYTVGPVGEKPTCTIPGHQLP